VGGGAQPPLAALAGVLASQLQFQMHHFITINNKDNRKWEINTTENMTICSLLAVVVMCLNYSKSSSSPEWNQKTKRLLSNMI